MVSWLVGWENAETATHHTFRLDDISDIATFAFRWTRRKVMKSLHSTSAPFDVDIEPLESLHTSRLSHMRWHRLSSMYILTVNQYSAWQGLAHCRS